MKLRRDESGQVAAFVVVFAGALILMAGLVIDGGLGLSAARRANNEAQAAARAGAQAIDEGAYRSTGNVSLAKTKAEDQAARYITQFFPDARFVGANASGDTIDVTVRVTQKMQILGIAGIGDMTLTGHGVAHAVRGVTRAGD